MLMQPPFTKCLLVKCHVLGHRGPEVKVTGRPSSGPVPCLLGNENIIVIIGSTLFRGVRHVQSSLRFVTSAGLFPRPTERGRQQLGFHRHWHRQLGTERRGSVSEMTQAAASKPRPVLWSQSSLQSATFGQASGSPAHCLFL